MNHYLYAAYAAEYAQFYASLGYPAYNPYCFPAAYPYGMPPPQVIMIIIINLLYFWRKSNIQLKFLIAQLAGNQLTAFYTSTKLWRGYIFIAVCLSLCLCVCQ